MTRRSHASKWAIALVAVMFAALCASPALAISNRTLIAPTGATSNDQLGRSVASAGDVNGDGYADVIVGAPFADVDGVTYGRAYVYYGGPAADAVPDLILTGLAADDRFGFAVGSAGDFNGDGYDDLVVGACLSDTPAIDAGQAYLFYGGPAADAVADLTMTGVHAYERFGASVGAAGDVNGDGYADVIVGAYLDDATGIEGGVAYVYFGGPGADGWSDWALAGYGAEQFGYSVGTAGDVNGDGYADVIVGARYSGMGGASYAGRAYVFYGGPVTDWGPDLILEGAAAGDVFGNSVGSAGDVNGDGYSDVIVGAPDSDADGFNAGRAYVFYGGPLADAVADLTLTGTESNALFGESVSGAGDVDGDGYADVLVGEPYRDVGGVDVGRVHLYFGGPWPDTIADLTLTGGSPDSLLGASVAGAGDVDGDGRADVIVGAPHSDTFAPSAGQVSVVSLYPYEILSPDGSEQWVAGRPATVRWLGHDVADIAISCDGGLTYATVASRVGGAAENEWTLTAPATVTEYAKVRVTYSGQAADRSTSDASDRVFRIVAPARAIAAASRLQRTFLGSASGDFFGWSVGTAGDVNGDGHADVIAGAPYNGAAGVNGGQAYLYYGGPGADAVADVTVAGMAGDYLGYSVGTAGDISGDGHADVMVGAFGNDAGGTNAGATYILFGGPGADGWPDLTLIGAHPGEMFGYSVGTAGDVNGDGSADMIIGAPYSSAGGTYAGSAYVYFGGPGADGIADLDLRGASSYEYLGWSVGTAGDVNGDGFSDVIAGAPFSSAGGASAGRAYAFFGGPGADAVPDLTMTGAAPDDHLGRSVGTAGDFNGDGYADVIVGADGNDAGGMDAGRAYIYFGGPGVDAVADLVLTGRAVDESFGGAVGTAGDVNGDGYADVIVGAFYNDAGGVDAGRAYVYHGGPGADDAPDLVLTGLAMGDNLGRAVGAAGDVNGDGLGDLVVGAPFHDAGGMDAGGVHLYDLNRYHLLSPVGGETWNVGALKKISWLGSEPADLWLSTDGGNSYELQETGVGGAASNVYELLVPHTPTKFARVKLTPADASVDGLDRSDSLFTIQTSVSLLALLAAPLPEGGASIAWRTEPGPEDLAGYRVERAANAGAWTTLVAMTRETSVTDPAGGPGVRYRLFAVNGLGEELWLGETSLKPARPLAAWPLPYRGGDLTVSFATYGGLGGGTGAAEVSVYDVRGRLVRRVARGDYAAGSQLARWDGRDETGRPVAAGIYLLRAKTAGQERTIKITVLR